MAELGNRISTVFLDTPELTEHFDSILSKPDDSKVTHVMMKELIRQINHSLDEIDTKIAGLKGGDEALGGGSASTFGMDAYTGAETFITGTETEFLSETIVLAETANVFIMTTFSVRTDTNALGNVLFRLYRDSTQLATKDLELEVSSTIAVDKKSSFTMMYAEALAAGTYEFRLTGEVTNAFDNTPTFSNGRLVVFAVI